MAYKAPTAAGARPIRLCLVATVPFAFYTFLREQIRQIVEAGIDLTLVSSPGPLLDELAKSIPVRCHPIRIERMPHPPRDLQALLSLILFFRRERFDIVHSMTPKGGLLAVLAGALTRIPIRIHTYTGQPWVEMKGILRWAACRSDVVIGRLATLCYADSSSQRDFLIRHNLVKAEYIFVNGQGSIGGVNLERFAPPSKEKRISRRRQLGIESDAVVIAFVGRVRRDKGICELTSAFSLLNQKYRQLHLVVVGHQEPNLDPLPEATLKELTTNPHVHMIGFHPKPEDYLAIADIFCLPSYREGFGSVVIEAGSMGLPAVATRVTGLMDAVIDGQTGLLVPSKDTQALADALRRMIESPDMRSSMGQEAHRWVTKHFDAAVVGKRMIEQYVVLKEKLKSRILPTKLRRNHLSENDKNIV